MGHPVPQVLQRGSQEARRLKALGPAEGPSPLILFCPQVSYRCGMAFSRPKKRHYSEDELYEYAVGALARRMRTVAELKRMLRARVEEAESEYGKTLIELVIRRLKDHGYLNDSQYAAYFSSLRRDNQKLGRRRVVTELKLKGIHGNVIDEAVDAAFEGVSEEKQAREYLRKKRIQKPAKGDRKATARIFRQLARAGFGSKTIFGVLKKWDVDDETLSLLEEESG
jgi:regulatory protein